jgi:membrane-associated HD superfamily phosphohydrolase
MTVTDNLKATVGNTSSLNDQISNLESQKIKIREEINKYRTLSGASDRMFLEDIYNGTPKMKIAPTLQDSVLLLFWFSWLLMSIVLVMVRWMSPDGSWKSALFVFVLLMLVTLCMFAIISYAA